MIVLKFQIDAKASQAEVPSVDNAKGIEKNLHPATFDTDRPSMATLANKTFTYMNPAKQSHKTNKQAMASCNLACTHMISTSANSTKYVQTRT
jgi:hypothetical protein